LETVHTQGCSAQSNALLKSDCIPFFSGLNLVLAYFLIYKVSFSIENGIGLIVAVSFLYEIYSQNQKLYEINQKYK